MAAQGRANRRTLMVGRQASTVAAGDWIGPTWTTAPLSNVTLPLSTAASARLQHPPWKLIDPGVVAVHAPACDVVLVEHSAGSLKSKATMLCTPPPVNARVPTKASPFESIVMVCWSNAAVSPQRRFLKHNHGMGDATRVSQMRTVTHHAPRLRIGGTDPRGIQCGSRHGTVRGRALHREFLPIRVRTYPQHRSGVNGLFLVQPSSRHRPWPSLSLLTADGPPPGTRGYVADLNICSIALSAVRRKMGWSGGFIPLIGMVGRLGNRAGSLVSISGNGLQGLWPAWQSAKAASRRRTARCHCRQTLADGRMRRG